MGKTINWFGPLCGMVSVVAVVSGAFVGGDVEPFGPANTVLAEFRDKADDIRLGSIISVFGMGLFLVFLAYFRTKLRDRGGSWAADGFFAGGVVWVAAIIVFVGVQLTGAEAGDNGHAAVAQGAADFLWTGTWILSPGLLAVGISAAAASFAYRALPTWLGIFAILVAVSAIVPWGGIFIFTLWVLAASIAELVTTARAEPVAETS